MSALVLVTYRSCNSHKTSPREFRRKRLEGVRASDVYVEVVANAFPSLSGALERGYVKGLRDLAKRLSPGLAAAVSEQFPARAFVGGHSSIVVMHNGCDFGGPGGALITTLYKQDPDSQYVYIRRDDEQMGYAEWRKLDTDFPGIEIVEFDKTKLQVVFERLFKLFLQEREDLIKARGTLSSISGLLSADYSFDSLISKRKH